MAKSAEETLRDDFEKLKADMSSLADDLRKVVKQTGNGAYARGRAAAEDAVARGRAAAEDVGDHITAAGQAVQRHVTERPMTSLAVSFLAGLVMGAIVRR